MNVYRNQQEEIYNVFHNEAVYVAPQALFHPELMHSVQPELTDEQKYHYDFSGPYFDFYTAEDDIFEEITGKPRPLRAPLAPQRVEERRLSGCSLSLIFKHPRPSRSRGNRLLACLYTDDHVILAINLILRPI